MVAMKMEKIVRNFAGRDNIHSSPDRGGQNSH